MRFWNTAANVATGLAIVSSLATAGIVVRNTFFTKPVASARTDAPRDVDDWQRLTKTGRVLGRPDASFILVEFADFQCPACNQLESYLQKLRRENPEDFAVAYHYAPLPYHRRAYDAARAAECAADQGRFESMHDAIFSKFSSLDTLTFAPLAAAAGVPNPSAFAECVARTDSVSRINADRALAVDSLRIAGTPTVIANGKMYAYLPPLPELKKMIETARAQRLARGSHSGN